jgi:hypothetical protein
MKEEITDFLLRFLQYLFICRRVKGSICLLKKESSEVNK